ncbi:hypothetical protein BKP37_10590 [Anaerobacillus alkalilacustris]|uniref:Carbonate dehydratase n=1 Tax=Anaerobacillus alkalilacustris TaxID=393763 RepID=A0A1S2LM47_9BACI|nr:hypothetical protein [Anaerobacillus alkalilacustris]OIJ13414.1 hypothetical protein BKP37_10590 [Anaerobacillus alkalilacustris]
MKPIIHHNPPIGEVASVSFPTISKDAVIGKGTIIVGDVIIEEHSFIGFNNLIRSDSSCPFFIGAYTNIQDFVSIHATPNEYLDFNGQKWGVFLEGNNSILHQAVVHGPIFIGNNTYVGQSTSLNHAVIGRNCVILHGATVANNVVIADDRFVEPGKTVWTQEQADALPVVPEKYKGLNEKIVDHYYRLGKSYVAHTPLFEGSSELK